MRKWLLIALALTVAVLGGGLVLGYRSLQAHLQDAPALVRASLLKQDIRLSYEKILASEDGHIKLSGVSLSGSGTPVLVQMESLSLTFSMDASLYPFQITVGLQHPEFRKNPDFSPSGPRSAPRTAADHNIASPWSTMGWASGWTKLVITAGGAKIPEWEMSGLTVSTTVKHLRWGSDGPDSAQLEHEILVSTSDRWGWLSGAHWAGRSAVDRAGIRAEEHQVGLGPFLLQMVGHYEWASDKWKVELSIPASNLQDDRTPFNPSWSPWITQASGLVGMHVNAQGVGLAFPSLYTEGKILARGVKLSIRRPKKLEGEVEGNIDIVFSKAKVTAVKGKALVDLTKLEIHQKDAFLKPRGVPFFINAAIEGKNDRLTLSRADARFHTLGLAMTGGLLMGAQPKGNLRLVVPPMTFAGWEQFFPGHPNFRAQGTLGAGLLYQGPLAEWRDANIEMTVKADGVRLPLLKHWVPIRGLDIDGVTALQTDTRLFYGQRTLRQLTTQTQIDLSQSNISYRDLFLKERGVPLEIQLMVTNTGPRADVKRGELILGNSHVHLRGKIDDFANPFVDLHYNTDYIGIKDLLTFWPAVKLRTFTNLTGSVQMKGEVTGVLIPRDGGYGPDARTELTLAQVAFDFFPDGTNRRIQATNVSGLVTLLPDVVSAKGLVVRLPNSNGQLDFRLQNFDEPTIEFAAEASRFNLKDLAPNGELPSLPFGLLTAPFSRAQSRRDDYRQKRWLRRARINGTIALRDAELGWAKADQVTAKINYDRLRLSLQPVNLRVLGGTIATSTVWDGRAEIPVTRFSVKANDVNADGFLAALGEKYKDALAGKLSTGFTIDTAGANPETMFRTARGGGGFAFNGEIRGLSFAKPAIEALQKTGATVSSGVAVERPAQLSGNFKVQDAKLLLYDNVLHTPSYDATSASTLLDFSQRFDTKLIWMPREVFISPEVLAAYKDSTGLPAVPLAGTGTLRSVSFWLDDSSRARGKANAPARSVSSQPAPSK